MTPLFPSELHAHTLDSPCLTPMPDGVTGGTPLVQVVQDGWYHCDRYPKSAIGLVHFHGDRAWRHEPMDSLCPISYTTAPLPEKVR
jgi:hypothetical protein